LLWDGEWIAEDPGTYSYNAPGGWDGFAGSRFHNVVNVGDHDCMGRFGRFLWLPWTVCQLRRQEDGLAAEHRGGGPDVGGVGHRCAGGHPPAAVGVRVTALLPGGVDTGFWKDAVSRNMPTEDFLTAEQVADAVVALARMEASVVPQELVLRALKDRDFAHV
jgi:hypothetical protein